MMSSLFLSHALYIDTQDDDTPEDDDLGPSLDQTTMDQIDKIEGVDVELSGTLGNTDCTIPTPEDADILDEIQNSHAGNDKGTYIKWPSFNETPVSQYSDNIILCMLFPWLYPGGNGHFNERHIIDITVKDFANQQLNMADGQFAKDNTWCVYALNYAKRRRNQVQGKWFVNNLLHSEKNQILVHRSQR
jgi:hypothetical protein